MGVILAIDDDPDVLGTLERVLRRENHQVTTLDSGRLAIQQLDQLRPDLLILDIIMPQITGIQVCQMVRRDPRFTALPILFLTAKGSTDDVVEGLDAGADDYIVKPFELAELRARVQALMRRGMRHKTTGVPVLQVGNLRLDSNTYQVYIGEEGIALTSTEHRLMRYFLEHQDQALSLTHLLQAVWEYPEDAGDPDLVRAHVRNLRAKIERDTDRKYIKTIHGVGYIVSSTAT